MSKYLIKAVETWRCDSEQEAQKMIAAAKADTNYVLTKYITEYKEVKAKGEVVDAFYKVDLTKTFTDIKEPDRTATVSYEVDYSQFPGVADEEEVEV